MHAGNYFSGNFFFKRGFWGWKYRYYLWVGTIVIITLCTRVHIGFIIPLVEYYNNNNNIIYVVYQLPMFLSAYVHTGIIELHTYMYHVRFGFQPENGMRKIGQRENRNTKALRNGE